MKVKAPIRRSVNEFCATLEKAAMAKGFPPDIAADVARAAAAISINGGDGIACAMDSIRRGMDAAVPPRDGRYGLVYPRTSAAGVGLAAAEFLCAEWREYRQPCIYFRSVDSITLLAELATSVAIAHRVSFELRYWHKKFKGMFPLQIPRYMLKSAGRCPRAELRIISRSNPRDYIVAQPQGIEIHSAGAWREAEALAAQTRVPASADSREEGAGAGRIDND